jgi:hypothetical protein
METIKEGTQVKYIGKTNDYTFNKDIIENSIGIVRNIFEVNGIIFYEVEFENGIKASIDSNELKTLI